MDDNAFTSDAWTPESTDELIRLWNLGRSAGDIAALWGGKPSRNAIVGKVHRLRKEGVEMRSGACIKDRETRTAHTPKPKRVKRERPALLLTSPDPLPTFKPYVIPPSAKHWTERKDGQCAWPVAGEGADTISCCRPLAGRWCAEHNAIGSVPVKKYKTAKVVSQVAWQERQAHASIEDIAAKTDGRRWA